MSGGGANLPAALASKTPAQTPLATAGYGMPKCRDADSARIVDGTPA
ncbi:hypothetical protein ACCUM_1675 [Candidatus Accumulibacter phosphatis]|uniref:Uncharacterized protein n=1 Tax=Candidatus Accumulibacter phosphatis TaxID=327160 RepID=A0A5S4ESM3_9PROT|nr:hypothetical protein ACCUM_1675 [Candidatus Accumulibacter phosphatis]